MAIPKQIHSVGVTDRFIHMLLVAGPGFGKTVFWGTGNEGILFLTTDPEGTVSAFMMGSTSKEWEIKHWEDIMECFRYLKGGGIAELGIKWVVIDNASEAQKLGMKANMERSRKGKPGLDEFIPTLDNHQRTQIMFLDMVKQFHDLPVNVGWTSWIETHEDAAGEEYFAPAIHGQKGAIAQEFAGLMNIVGYGEVIEDGEDELRRVWFTHSGPYRGKDRYVALGKKRDGLDVPKMERIIAAAVKKRIAEKGATSAPANKVPTARRAASAAPARRSVRKTTTK